MRSSFRELLYAYAQEQVDSWIVSTTSRRAVGLPERLDGQANAPVEDLQDGDEQRRR
jgi:hypothetical protein